jgi:hypothetical protein
VPAIGGDDRLLHGLSDSSGVLTVEEARGRATFPEGKLYVREIGMGKG